MTQASSQQTALPLVLSGPILRRTLSTEINLWLVTSVAIEPLLLLYADAAGEQALADSAATDSTLTATCHRAGGHCFIYNITAAYPNGLPQDQFIYYDLQLCIPEQHHEYSGQTVSLKAWGDSSLTYDDHLLPGFVIQSRIKNLLHGSCRKPHHNGEDGLALADRFCQHHLKTTPSDHPTRCQDFPALLILSGDQIYADDVAGPMLCVIHQLIALLDFPAETLNLTGISTSEQLYGDTSLLYARDALLPDTREATSAYDAIFGGARKPVFTSVHAKNHLITLAEVIAMYLLIWSPNCWALLAMQTPSGLAASNTERFKKETTQLKQFVAQLADVSRVMAHVPVAMIFDDHDVTDDWNLTAAWERAAYGNPLSSRIIGNTLIGYLLCQSWGNAPVQFSPLSDAVTQALAAPSSNAHRKLIETLTHYPQWGYTWPTTPLLKVLDTRTQRWRSERSPTKPSGLLDWESLCQLQQTLINEPSVLLVAPAPVFGVKLIETIQKVMTWLGQPLMVDAENWMAHKGTAHTLLHMFCHAKTPKHFVILSGDVHYSFVYKIRIRGEKSSPHIWQITSSGLRNTFPAVLLAWLDKLNRWLYSPASPLNWFTQRRHMRVQPYHPNPRVQGQRLVNQSGIGLVCLDEQGRPVKITQLTGQNEAVTFEP